jgi:light-regulated signal transduction histidine kinase (bacteriophytochrome)
VGTNIDVTEQALARQKLERVNRELQQFVSIVSHDLQAPTRAIGTFSKWLEERHGDGLDDEGRKLVGFIQVSAHRMLGLLRGLLEYSHAGVRPAQEREEVDCNHIVTRVLSTLEAEARQCGAIISVGPLPVVSGWAGPLEQLFQNLIDNALKHGSAGPPLISVSARATESAWEFAVEDNGVGIDMTRAAGIFLPFERLRARNEGSGMGLAICKRVAEQHGGSIWVESEVGKGCRFCFTIPQFPLDGFPRGPQC